MASVWSLNSLLVCFTVGVQRLSLYKVLSYSGDHHCDVAPSAMGRGHRLMRESVRVPK